MIRKLFQNPVLFLIVYGLIGLFTVRDYGVPIDDFTQYVIGQENYHVLIGEQKVEKINPEIRYYGPAFETFCYAIDSMFYGEPEPIQKWGMRHAFVFVLFTMALGFFWKICRTVFDNTSIAWFLMISMAFMPRLFADAHYNSKDTVFLSLIIMAMVPALKSLSNQRSKYFWYAGILLGLATTMRLAGFFFIPAFLAILFFYSNEKIKKYLKNGSYFLIGFYVSYYVFFPALWHNPFQEFAIMVQRITHFPWPNDTLVAGVWVGKGHMPWWYFPVWFFATVPLVYSLLFILAIFGLVFLKKPNPIHPFLLVNVLFLLLTLGYIFLFTPNLYDSWRQLQFLTIPILLISGVVAFYILQVKRGSYILGIVGCYLFFALWNGHPFQYVYFNEYQQIMKVKNRYDLDYWQLSTGNCMKWIAKNDTNKLSRIYVENSNSGWLNGFLIPKTDKKEFETVTDRALADYEIIPIRNKRPFDQTADVVYSIVPYQDTIARVIKLKNNKSHTPKL